MSQIKDGPLVSVLMTAYNREKYIGMAIQSVLNSSYKYWELIIVDDVSKDNTLKIAEEYAKQDPRISVYQNDVNLGDYPNRNKAAGYAQGKYLKYIDADDCVYEYGLEIMVMNMERFPDAGWGLLNFKPDEYQLYPKQIAPKEAYGMNYLSRNTFNTQKIFSRAPLSSIIKRDVFEQNNGFHSVRHFGDGDLWNRLGRNYPVVMMQEGLVWYRKHEDQEQKKRKKNFAAKIRTWNNIIEHLSHPECPLPPESVRPYIRSIKRHQRKIIFRSFLKTRSLSVVKELYRELRSESIR
jgi:glycosyltransferase involved in cell wall biosynthesis